MRLEKRKHLEAESRLRTFFLRRALGIPYDYEGRQEDMELARRKLRERSEAQIRRVVHESR